MRCFLRGRQGSAYEGIKGFVYQDEEFEFHLKCIGKTLEGCMVRTCDLMYIFKNCVAGEAVRVLMVPSLDSME